MQRFLEALEVTRLRRQQVKRLAVASEHAARAGPTASLSRRVRVLGCVRIQETETLGRRLGGDFINFHFMHS